MSRPLVTRFMIDTETLGLASNAVILSIGAVAFYPGIAFSSGSDPTLYMELDTQAQLAAGRVMEADTLMWWDKRKHFQTIPNQGKVGIHQAIHTLNTFILDTLSEDVENGYSGEYEVWCKGTDFDIPKLTSLASIAGIRPAWEYNQVRDHRTLSAMFPQIPKSLRVTTHHALNDAIDQAEHCARILKELGK